MRGDLRSINKRGKLFLLILFILFSPLYPFSLSAQTKEGATVTRIVDGDTLKVFYLEGEESIDLPPLFVPPLKLEFVFIQIVGA